MTSTEATNKAGNLMTLDEGAEEAVRLVLEVKARGGKVMLAGNGGSAAVVSHVQNDMCKWVGVRSLVFTEQPLLTALANDEGYGSVYEMPVELWAERGDLLITVSSSGKSENILRALEASIAKDCRIVTFSGFAADNLSRQKGDVNFYVKSDFYGFVETAHAALTHYITDRAGHLALLGKA
jgi:D-sedoheptulose 7-phosphate isomerase